MAGALTMAMAVVGAPEMLSGGTVEWILAYGRYFEGQAVFWGWGIFFSRAGGVKRNVWEVPLPEIFREGIKGIFFLFSG